MSSKPVIRQAQAKRDIEEVVRHHAAEADERVVENVIAELERASDHLAHHPATGSLRYAYALDLPDLRVWPLKRFPYLMFYVERDDHVEIWRVLHHTRDLEASLRELGSR